jgi:hypothetical protein
MVIKSKGVDGVLCNPATATPMAEGGDMKLFRTKSGDSFGV